jgi:Spy/CpxP family protein refolding chaperone
MKRLMLLASAAAIALAAAQTSWAAEAAKPPESPKAVASAKPSLPGELAVMADECKLSEEQKARLASAAAEHKAATEAWEKKHANQLAAFRKARSAAIEAKDETALRKVYDDIKPLVEESRTAQTKYQTAVMAILTPEQKVALQGYALGMEMQARLRKFDLTPDQAAEVRRRCDEAAKELAATKGEDVDAQRAVLDKLTAGIRDKVLTDKQRAMIAKPGDEDNPPADQGPAAEKPKAEAPNPAPEKKPDAAPGK